MQYDRIARLRALHAGGTFGYVDTSVPGAELNAYFR